MFTPRVSRSFSAPLAHISAAMHAKLLMLALFFLVLTDAQSCIGFSKGSYSGDVTSQDECRTACETAEGFCCPDFKTLSDSNKTYYKCSTTTPSLAGRSHSPKRAAPSSSSRPRPPPCA